MAGKSVWVANRMVMFNIVLIGLVLRSGGSFAAVCLDLLIRLLNEAIVAFKDLEM